MKFASNRPSGKKAVALALILTILAAFTPFATANAQNQVSLKIGVWGDDSSRGNIGVRVEIRTHVYDAYSGVLDYFWVGDSLDDGAFIQFGYGFEPGYYCLKGVNINGKVTCLGRSELIMDSDARWQWQYWPNLYRPDFYYEIGPGNSAGTNGSWHLYSITPASAPGWTLLLDGQEVARVSFPFGESRDPASIVAEKIAVTQLLGNLGPVEFRNLSYLRNDGWHAVDSLMVLSTCTTGSSCGLNQPYGISLEAPNHVVAGSGIDGPKNGELLWTSDYVTLNVRVHPQTPFYVSSISGRQLFSGNATLRLPKGMFAHVSLIDSRTAVGGIFGALGAQDEFQGWLDDNQSGNPSITILMDKDKTVQAIWRPNFNVPLVIAVAWLVCRARYFYDPFLGDCVEIARI